ncbi:MAG: pseudoazurin [Oleiphilaceae bacterium]|nr:pseudoazurin [Oleiphilaceae bacterium]
MSFNFKHVALAAAILIPSTSALAAEHTIEMKNNGADGTMVFEPGFIKAEKGDTIKFKATDPAHNSISVAVPEGAESWEGAMNEEIEITLDEEGVYVYKCTPHAVLNMVGVIQVGSPTNMDAAEEAVAELTDNAATNKDRGQMYLDKVDG